MAPGETTVSERPGEMTVRLRNVAVSVTTVKGVYERVMQYVAMFVVTVTVFFTVCDHRITGCESHPGFESLGRLTH